MTIIRVNQGMLHDLSGRTVGEVKGIFAACEVDLDKKAKAKGYARTKLSPWLRVFEAEAVPRCPWGNEQYVADEKGVLGSRRTNWDSSGQCLVEYAATCGLIALVTLGAVLAFGLISARHLSLFEEVDMPQAVRSVLVWTYRLLTSHGERKSAD